jgi:hypothetical protein
MRLLLLTLAAILPTITHAAAPRPANIVTREEWKSNPDPIPDDRKHTPRFITLHHAGVLWTNSQTPEQFIRNMQAWGKRRPEVEQPPRTPTGPTSPTTSSSPPTAASSRADRSSTNPSRTPGTNSPATSASK